MHQLRGLCISGEPLPEDAARRVLASYATIGLQASRIADARRVVQSALFHPRPDERVFVAYTSNLVSSGLRDCFARLARERRVAAFISSAGGVEEDAIKCLGRTVVGEFALDGKELRRHGINRIGNLLVPNENYCAFEDFFTPVLASLHARQRASAWEDGTAPSDFIAAMGAALPAHSPTTYEESLVYWCHQNHIPFFSPALTDGSMGDMMYFYNFGKKGLAVDPMADVMKMRAMDYHQCTQEDGGVRAGYNTAIILGGGLPKNHLLSNIKMDRVVVVTTGGEAEGCSSSCIIEDDRAAGLISPQCEVIRVQGDASFIFPLLLATE